MDGPLLSLPRLRLTRNAVSYSDENSATPAAGPSRLPLDDDNDEDTQSTPRVPTAPHLVPNFPLIATPPFPADTPAARLRALLARVPSESPRNNPPAPSSPSEPDSDFYPPHLNTTNTPHESLKELFSRALRDPGDTPEKPRRRNSIDLSEVDASPRLDRVKKERAKSKGKRKSLSDEELDKTSRSSQSHSQATTFHTLRQRLANSQFDLDIKDVALPTDQSYSDLSQEPSHDTATILRHSNSSKPSPPAATSTPLRSMQLPSQIENQSNLLDQDSEMQRALKNMDSYEEGDSARPVSFPLGNSTPDGARDNSSVTKRGNLDFLGHSSNMQYMQPKLHTVSQSKIPGLARHHSTGSSPQGDSPAVADPSANGLPTRSSVASLHHAGGGQSPRKSSMLSNSDFRERNSDIQQDKLKEREREWNRPYHALTRSSSSLNLHASGERTRTISHPTRPNSSHALTVDRLELHRQSLSGTSMRADSPASSMASSFELDKDRHAERQHEVEHQRERNWNSPHPKSTHVHSPTPSTSSEHVHRSTHRHSIGGTPNGLRSRFDSLSSSTSSRASSPSGSMSSKDSQEEIIHEIEHERERNWNSSHPKWNKRHSIQHVRSISPLPSSPSSPVQGTPHHNHTHSRDRTQSLTANGSSPHALRPSLARNSASTSNSSLNVKIIPSLRPKSPVPRPSPSQHSLIPASPRPNSPLPGPFSPAQKSPGLNSNFGWKFPKGRVPLPPLNLDHEDHPPADGTKPITTSHIPPTVKLSKKAELKEPHNELEGESKMRGHRRSPIEASEAFGPIPPKINVETVVFPSDARPTTEDMIHGSDEESPIGSTPLARPVSLPSPPTPVDGPTRMQNAMGSPHSQTSTPPPSPPKVSADTTLSLATPPRRSSFNSSRIEFQTPSPPKGMPDLPGPPSSSSDDEYANATPPVVNGCLTLVKTPKPPGAWLQTPAQLPRSASPLVRANSMPEDDVDLGGGLATPPSTLSKANSFPAQTPAPPGAWMGTPSVGSVGRKSILKVRFDLASETETMSSADGLGNEQVSLESIQMVHPSDEGMAYPESRGQGEQQPTAIGNGHAPSAPSPEEPATPVLKPIRRPRTPPSVRMVDAFGRERVNLSEGQSNQIVPPTTPPLGSSQGTKSRNGSVRIVDAMGRQVEDNGPPSSVREDGASLTREEAFARLKETVSSLARDMSDADLSSADGLPLDDPRFKELRNVSAVARNARQRLTESLQLMRSPEDDLRAKYGPLRESMKKSNGDALPNVIHRTRFSRFHVNTWVFGSVVFLQIMFIIYMYHMSHARARDLFLTNYYDPFSPHLHIHITKPDAFRYSISAASSVPWSVYNVPDTFKRAGLGGVCSEFWGNVTLAVSAWQRRTWEAWQDYGRTSVVAWPPT